MKCKHCGAAIKLNQNKEWVHDLQLKDKVWWVNFFEGDKVVMGEHSVFCQFDRYTDYSRLHEPDEVEKVRSLIAKYK